MAVKYVFVTGGVVSGLGKGITAASLGRLLKARGYQVTMQKFDPYINIDPGTMNPIQHGEVFVTDDGTETDLDLGHYERFIDESLDKNSNVTTGKVYWSVLQKERHGDFGGGTVQVIPHITNEIKGRFYRAKSSDEDKIAIIEVGGTVGDIESQPFLEAIRQFQHDVGHDNAILIHVTLIPYLKASEEMKTKPTQASVKELQGMGIQPDVLVCRSEHELTEDIKEKIALFCNVPVSHVLQNLDVEYLYEAPLAREREKLADVVLSSLRLENRKPDLSDWEEMVESLRNPNKTVKIAIVGKGEAVGQIMQRRAQPEPLQRGARAGFLQPPGHPRQMLPGVFCVMLPKKGALQGTAGIGEGIVIRLDAPPQKHPPPQRIQGEPLIF